MTASPKKTILIIEDDQDIRDTLQQVLEYEGFRVLTGGHGAEGLALLRDGARPDLIILDLMMPVMNGWEFLEQVGRDPAYKAIPVFVVTAAGERSDTFKAAGFIEKPFEVDELLDTIRPFVHPSE